MNPQVYLRKISWNAIFGLVTVVSLFFAIYTFFYEKKPSLQCEIVSEANVLDVRQPVKDLSINFLGENIQETGRNLRIYKLSIRNQGDAGITQNMYDVASDWGLKIKDGKIIEIRLLSASQTNITDSLQPSLVGDGKIKFGKIIFDKGDEFELEILVIHTKDVLPTFESYGRIAGVKQMRVFKKAPKKEDWERQAFSGTIIVQLLRGFLYFTVVLLLIAIISSGQEKASKILKKRQRNHRSNQMAQLLKNDRSIQREAFDLLSAFYIESGYEGISRLKKRFDERDDLLLRLFEFELAKDYKDKISNLGAATQDAQSRKEPIQKSVRFIVEPQGVDLVVRDLFQKGLIIAPDFQKVIITPSLEDVLNKIFNVSGSK